MPEPDLRGFKCVRIDIKTEEVFDPEFGSMVVDLKPVAELAWYEHPDGRCLSQEKNLLTGEEKWGTERKPGG